MAEPYRRAQLAMAELKAAVHEVLAGAAPEALSNAEIGRALGIYVGHVGHEGHISRTVLSLMEAEGVVEQDATNKRWRVRQQGRATTEPTAGTGKEKAEGDGQAAEPS